jgi:hypothetical protein
MLHECNNSTYVWDEVYPGPHIKNQISRQKSEHHNSTQEIVLYDDIQEGYNLCY